MGQVIVGCGRCERGINVQSPEIDGERAETLRAELRNTPAPFSLTYSTGEYRSISVTAPKDSCDADNCPLTESLFTQASRMILNCITKD